MNISQILRSVIGNVQAEDPKTLELKVGQVVKGLVTQLLSDKEAMINIGGVQVRARLETPLSQGQTTFLQVQPESSGTEIVLKPLQNSSAPIAEQSMPDLLKQFGLKDGADSRQVIRLMHQEGVTLTKESVGELMQAMRERPAATRQDEWGHTAILALKRGLPLTKESIGSLQRVLFGQPVDQTLELMQASVHDALESGEGEHTMRPQTRELLGTIKQALAQLGTVEITADRPSTGETFASKPQASSSAGRNEVSLQADPSSVAVDDTDKGAQGRTIPSGAAMTGEGKESSELAPERLGSGRLAPEELSSAGDANWVKRLLKELGVDHELRILHQPQQDKEASSTLKGLLLQLASAEDAPAAVRETAQQLVQQITGQQLLLSPDRASMFSHVTLMLPLQTMDGNQTAAIHIQSRKGSRGELDATNCRLLFDLDMRALGSTLLDVQVVDKIVSLQVHNDQPFIADLLGGSREDIATAMQAVGYQFLSLKCLPYPEKLSSMSDSQQQGNGVAPGIPTLRELYKDKLYKGMDTRV